MDLTLLTGFDMDLISKIIHEIMKFKSLAAKGNAECGSSELSSAKIADIDSAGYALHALIKALR